MTDPFAEVRENARRHWQDAPFALIQAKTDFDKLLADADALLAVVPALQDALAWIMADYEDGNPEATTVYLAGKKALAALPEYLKGDNDEQSRKA